MNITDITKWAIGLTLAAASLRHVPDLQNWIWKAEGKLLYEARTSQWGSPHFFPDTPIPATNNKRGGSTERRRKQFIGGTI